MNPVVTLNRVEHLLSFLEQLIPTNCRWALSKCHCIETWWRVPCLPTRGCPKSLLLVHFQRYCWLFSSSTGSWWGEHPGWPRQTWSRSTLPRVSEHSDVTGFFPADPSLLARMHFKRNRTRVLWGVKSRLVLCPKRTFFSNNYHIVVSTQERHDVKMKLLKTFLD